MLTSYRSHHTVNVRASPKVITTGSGDVKFRPTPRPSSSVPELLATSMESQHRRRRGLLRSSKSESAIQVPIFFVTPGTFNDSRPANSSSAYRSSQVDGCSKDISTDVHLSAEVAKDMRNPGHQHGCRDHLYHDPNSYELITLERSAKEPGVNYERVPSAAQRFRAKIESNLQADVVDNSSQLNLVKSNANSVPLIHCTSQASSRASFHLQNMQISQRLRSSSNASDAVSFLTRRTNGKSHHSRSPSNTVYSTNIQPNGLHHRQLSKSGFMNATLSVPRGIIHRDETSSLYSSRPDSNPASPTYFSRSPSQRLRSPTAIFSSYATAPSQAAAPSQASDNKQDDALKPVADSAVLPLMFSDRTDSPATKQAQRSQASSSNLSRTSKFVEDMDALTEKPVQDHSTSRSRPKKKTSTLNFFRFSRTTKPHRSKITNVDGPADDSDRLPKTSIPLLPSHDEAAEMWERALIAHAEEKAFMWLKPDDHRGDLTSKRERRQSEARSHGSSQARSSHRTSEFHTPAQDSIDIDPFDVSKERTSSLNPIKGHHITKEQKRAMSYPGHPLAESPERRSSELSAWSRYPSYTRPQRCGSAGPDDNVFPRDFGLIPTDRVSEVQSCVGPDAQSRPDVDPKRLKKRFGFGSRSGKSTNSIRRIRNRLPKSRSLNFGRTVLKHYASLFKPQSHEFFHYGHGHRSSVSTGGTLDNPELEILRPVLPPFSERRAKRSNNLDGREIELTTLNPMGTVTSRSKGKAKATDGAYESTLTNIRISKNKPSSNSAADDDAEVSLGGPEEARLNGDSSMVDSERFSDLTHSMQLSRQRMSSGKRKRRFLSSQSESAHDHKTRTRVTSVASAWSKVYEECVDHDLLQGRPIFHDDTSEEESAISLADRARDSNIRTLNDNESKHALSTGIDQGVSNFPRPRTPARTPLAALKQGRLLPSVSMYDNLQTRWDEMEESRGQGQALVPSASAPLLGKSEVNFLETLRKNEGRERESVLRKADELIV